jgi:hypothetical protein
VIAQATGALVAALVLAVAVMLVASTTMMAFFRYRPLNALVAAAPPAASLAAKARSGALNPP